jgi:hypothetical protein
MTIIINYFILRQWCEKSDKDVTITSEIEISIIIMIICTLQTALMFLLMWVMVLDFISFYQNMKFFNTKIKVMPLEIFLSYYKINN